MLGFYWAWASMDGQYLDISFNCPSSGWLKLSRAHQNTINFFLPFFQLLFNNSVEWLTRSLSQVIRMSFTQYLLSRVDPSYQSPFKFLKHWFWPLHDHEYNLDPGIFRHDCDMSLHNNSIFYPPSAKTWTQNLLTVLKQTWKCSLKAFKESLF